MAVAISIKYSVSLNAQFTFYSHANTGHVTKTPILKNSRWRTAAILKIALSPYFSCELSDFDQIWYTNSEHGNLTKKSKFFQIQNGGRMLYWKSFLAIFRRLIGRLTQMEMTNHTPIEVT